MDTPASLAYVAAKDLVKVQSDTLDNLRTRAAALFTANAVVAAFLGSTALKGDESLEHVATWIGLAAFLLASVLLGFALLPLFRWEFGMNVAEVQRFSGITNDAEMTAEAYLGLAAEFEAYEQRNGPKLIGLMWILIGASLLTLVASLSWLIEVA